MNTRHETNGFRADDGTTKPAWAGVVSLSLGVFGLVLGVVARRKAA